jgi:hypothetical protein
VSKKKCGDMAESHVENGGKLNLKSPTKRQEYLDLIDRLLETSFTKAQGHYCKNSERIAWVRAISGLIVAGSAVLKDEDLDDLEKRLEKIENERVKGTEKS